MKIYLNRCFRCSIYWKLNNLIGIKKGKGTTMLVSVIPKWKLLNQTITFKMVYFRQKNTEVNLLGPFFLILRWQLVLEMKNELVIRLGIDPLTSALCWRPFRPGKLSFRWKIPQLLDSTSWLPVYFFLVCIWTIIMFTIFLINNPTMCLEGT